MLDDEIGDPGDEREQREAGERFGPGRQVGEKGKSVEDCEAFGRELAHGVVPAGKRVLSPVAVSGADRVTIATAPVKSWVPARSEEHTSELQSLMRISYAVFCLKKKKRTGQEQNPS